MMSDSATAQAIARFPSGITGLDTILKGGLFSGGIYIVMGVPGAGKTILANQICFAQVARGGRAIYVTLLSESHGRMLALLRPLAFFDSDQVANNLYYISGYNDLQEKGLRGLLDLVRTAVRAQRAGLVVIDGVTTVSDLALSDLDFKRFIQELQVYLEPLGCTALLLAQPGFYQQSPPEHTMVDGIIQLRYKRIGLRAARELEVLKLRGSSFLSGGHFFQIDDQGMSVHPRTESHLTSEPTPREATSSRMQFGISGLDSMLGGGIPSGSTTMLLGASGSGKTTLGLHFLATGAQNGEPGLHVGFYEAGPRLIVKAHSVGLEIAELVEQDTLRMRWYSTSDRLIDAIAEQVLADVATRGVRRVFIDGFEGLRSAAFYPNRVRSFLDALTNELQARNISTLLTVEMRDLLGSRLSIPLTGVSEIVDNILLIRQMEVRSQLYRTLSVIKMRDSEYDPVIRAMTISSEGVRVGVPLAVIIEGNPADDPPVAPQSGSDERRRRSRGEGRGG